MNFGWFVIINGLIGLVLLVPISLLSDWIIRKKYGNKVYERGMEDTLNMTQETGQQLFNTRNEKVIYVFVLICTIFLWEIEWPLKLYFVIMAMKDEKDYEDRYGGS